MTAAKAEQKGDVYVLAPNDGTARSIADEFAKDFTLNQSLQPVYNSLKQLVDNLSDTLMLSGHEAYAQALLYYASVKMAARLGDQDAKSIHEDLSKRFVRQNRQANPADTKPNDKNLAS